MQAWRHGQYSDMEYLQGNRYLHIVTQITSSEITKVLWFETLQVFLVFIRILQIYVIYIAGEGKASLI